MWIWLLACGGPRTVEVPGRMVAGGAEGAWPEAVPSLAGCTWTERKTDGSEEITWTYDRVGRLRSSETRIGDLDGGTEYTWRGGCLTEVWEEPVASGAPSLVTIHRFTCDDRDNKIAWATTSPGDESPTEAREFVNTYDALDQLATVETWSVGSDAELLFVDTHTWNADGRPLVQVQEAPLEAGKTTWTWWWDHELLLGRDEEGTGADAYMVRTYEDRRLVSETMDSDAAGLSETTWEYLEPSDRFPLGKTVTGVDGAITDWEIDASCRE